MRNGWEKKQPTKPIYRKAESISLKVEMVALARSITSLKEKKKDNALQTGGRMSSLVAIKGLMMQ